MRRRALSACMLATCVAGFQPVPSCRHAAHRRGAAAVSMAETMKDNLSGGLAKETLAKRATMSKARLAWPVSGCCPKLRPASANQPLGPPGLPRTALRRRRSPSADARSKCPLGIGSALARLPRLLRVHLAALASLALPGEATRSLGIQPLPRELERAASTVAYSTAPQATRHAA